MTQAQKTAKDKFKKAIAYRTKTGVSLKEAFAHIYGKKAAVKKKAAPKKKAAVKKKAVKKAAPKKKTAVKKVAVKKKAATKKVNRLRFVSGVESISTQIINQLKVENEKLIKWQSVLSFLNIEKSKVSKGLKPVVNMDIKRVKNAIKEQKIHIQQLKKNIK